jgi:hypothetical protein
MELDIETWTLRVNKDVTKDGHVTRMGLLQEKNLFEALEADLLKLDRYLFSMLYATYAGPEAWPERPQLTDLLWTEQECSQKTPQSADLKQRCPQQSSQE